jgi:hypothetical protein
MMLLRLLNAQGIAGLAASLCLAILLVIQKGETRHWKKQSASFDQLYRAEQAALAGNRRQLSRRCRAGARRGPSEPRPSHRAAARHQRKDVQ